MGNRRGKALSWERQQKQEKEKIGETCLEACKLFIQSQYAV